MDITYKIALYGAIVASYAAFVATSVFIWDIIKWRKDRPKLRIDVGGVVEGRGEYAVLALKCHATNMGKSSVILEKERFVFLSSPIKEFIRIRGQDILRLSGQASYDNWEMEEKLESGERWEGSVRFHGIKPEDIQKGYIYCGVKHSIGQKIYYGKLNLKNILREGRFD